MIQINDKRFKALLITQFLGAFNDNALKLMMSLFIVNSFLGTKLSGVYISLLGIIFILPFIIFSTYAGYLADKFSKKNIIIGSKLFEFLIMIIGAFFRTARAIATR